LIRKLNRLIHYKIQQLSLISIYFQNENEKILESVIQSLKREYQYSISIKENALNTIYEKTIWRYYEYLEKLFISIVDNKKIENRNLKKLHELKKNINLYDL